MLSVEWGRELANLWGGNPGEIDWTSPGDARETNVGGLYHHVESGNEVADIKGPIIGYTY